MPNTVANRHPTRPVWAAALALLTMLAAPALTQAQGHAHHGSPAATPAATPMTALPWTDAEVRRIDQETGKITLRHGHIQNLDMPPMTMVFTVRDKALLDKAQAGAKVRVQVVSDNGQMVVTDLQPAP